MDEGITTSEASKTSSTKKVYHNPKGGLETPGFLRRYGLSELRERFKISIYRHSRYQNLVQLKYTQSRSPMNSKIVQECRGLIVNEDRDWEIVAFPYYKFFNYAEPHAPDLDWSNITVYEKIDGSIATLYWWEGSWEVASSSLPDARGPLGPDQTFSSLFWDIWKKLNYKLPTNRRCCYMFEMLTPRNIIVVRPDREAIMLHGVRDLDSMEEMDPLPVAKEHGWEFVPMHNFRTLSDIIKSTRTLNPIASGKSKQRRLKAEGYVIRDVNWNRVKVKSPQYVALSHLSIRDKGGLNMRSMLQIVRTHEGDEFLSYFPYFAKLHQKVKTKYSQLVDRVQRYWNEVSPTWDNNEFEEFLEENCSDHRYRHILRKMRAKQVKDAKSFLEDYELKELFLWVREEIAEDDKSSDLKYWEDLEQISKKKKKKKVEPVQKKLDGFEIDDVSLVGNGTSKKKKGKSKNAETREKPKSRRERRQEEDLDQLLKQFADLDAKVEVKDEDDEEKLPKKSKKKKKGKKR